VTFLRASYQTEAEGSLRLRVGRSVGHDMMVYVLGGVAAARTQYSAISDFRPTGTVFYQSHFTKTETGAIGGVGAEWGIGNNWTMRAEYTLADYGDESSTANPSLPLPPFQVHYNWTNTHQSLGFGLNYHF
jgi:opacity protein-like surface antigen